MKNLKFLALAFTALFASCVNDEFKDPDLSGDCATLTATKSVQDVAAMASSSYLKYENEDIIEAYVTSSDEGGNFYKSISMVSVDGQKAFSIPVDDYNLYTKYPPGQKVFVNMKNRYIVTEFGGLLIGNLYNGGTADDPTDDEVGRISPVEYQSIITRSCTGSVSEAAITNNITVSQALNDSYLNKLIEFDNVQFTDASLGKTYYDATLNDLGGATNHLITDQFGNTIIVRISSYATFASKAVPSKSGKIRGVLTKFNSDYQFMVRTESDINLTNDRLAIDFYPPLGGSALSYFATLNEPFTSYNTTNQQVFSAYINDAVVGSRYWQVKTFSGNKYIQMTSFGGTPEANRTLFFVPVDFTAASTFSFKTKAGFANGNCLKVYYTTDYVAGGDATAATLVDITSSFTISPGLSSGYPTNFTNSGNYAIPGTLTGNGFFVFEYVGNGTGVTTTMQIDDIVIN
ncbi:DUF5689 domain-containing protein [Flavobacterium sedimenticola]|uniref:DUF5689 domain-containing protein n=1 Tax=Flavobacterium sedimenticola TaxID=3043286 RepID=A0ABT6XLW9_9FLAO|nr:DUF5689 domain-containing protein [Flavobacterium sedimenticola]MDI9256008.1 DUF5689 domain-containing protein [Flavobacterium sedimenticola]